MAKKNFNAWELQQKVNEVDNKAEKIYVDNEVKNINNKFNSSLEEKANKTDVNDKFSKVNSQLEQKAPSDYVRQSTDIKPINYTEFDTETRKLFTGGNVAVVGENSVGKENLKEKAVNFQKVDYSILRNPFTNLLSSDLYKGTDVNGGTIDSDLNGIITFSSTSTYGTFNRILKISDNKKYIVISKVKVLEGSGIVARHICYSYSNTEQNLGVSDGVTHTDLKPEYVTIITKLGVKTGGVTGKFGLIVNKPCKVEIKDQIILDVTGIENTILDKIDFENMDYFQYAIENTALYSKISSKSVESEKATTADFALNGDFAKATNKFQNILETYDYMKSNNMFFSNGVTTSYNDVNKEITSTPTEHWGQFLMWTPSNDEKSIKYNRKYKLIVKIKKTSENASVKGTLFMYTKDKEQLGSVQSTIVTLTDEYATYEFDFTISKENCYMALVGITNASSSEPYGTFVMKDFMLIDITDSDIPLDYIDTFGYWENKPKIGLISEKSIVAEKAMSLDDNCVLPFMSKWKGKNALVIGDSITASRQWQLKLKEQLGMNVTTHAKGGVGLVQMVDGDKGLGGDYDNETDASGELKPLSIKDVTGIDLIIFFGGYNNRGTADGEKGEVYNPDNQTGKTIAGMTQYCINRIYEVLNQANNLSCKILIVTPHCAGKYPYIDANGYQEYPSGSGRTMETLSNTIKLVSNYNNIPVCDLWHNSGINKFTWDIYGAYPNAHREDITGISGPYPHNGDQLHCSAKGYARIGECIVGSIIKSYGY